MFYSVTPYEGLGKWHKTTGEKLFQTLSIALANTQNKFGRLHATKLSLFKS